MDDQSHATEEVIQTIQTLTIDVEDILDDWELLPHIQDYERSIDKPGDTIIVAEAEQEAARTLITPEQTPEPIAQNQLPTHSGPRPRLLRPTSEPDHSDEPD